MEYYEQVQGRHPDGLPMDWTQWEVEKIQERIQAEPIRAPEGEERTQDEIREELGLPKPTFEIGVGPDLYFDKQGVLRRRKVP